MSWLRSIKPFLADLKKIDPIPTVAEPHYFHDPSIKVVVFDIYGTLLISSSGDITQADISTENLITALDACAIDYPRENTILQQILNGLRHEISAVHVQNNGFFKPEIDIKKIWSTVLTDADLAFEKSQLVSVAFIFETLSNKVYPMPGMQKTILALADRGIPLGIVSNAQFYTPIVMNWFLRESVYEKQIVSEFENNLQIYSYKEGRAKPDVALYKKLARNLKVYDAQPRECLYIGNDMLKDVWAAQQAGFKTGLFAGDARSLRWRAGHPQLNNVKPDFIFTHLEQILEIVSC